MLERNLYNMLYENTKKFPKRTFIYFEEKKYTYTEGFKIINQMAAFMQKKGVKKGDKVIIMLGNSPEYVLSVFAVFACGAIAIPINTFFKGNEASYIVENSEALFMITEGQFEAVVEEVRVQCKKLQEIFTFDNKIVNTLNFYEYIDNMPDAPIECKASVHDLALFIYTSGTTGHPKGAMLSHYNLLENATSCDKMINASHKDKFLILLPMFHTYTFTTCIIYPISVGSTLIILRSVMDMKKDSFKKILIFQRPTIMLGVPQIYSVMAKSPMPKWFIKLLYPIKIHISGGAALPAEIFNQFKKKFGINVIEGYGLSEASPVVALNPLNKQKQGTIGVTLPNIQAKIIGEDETELPRGQVGELIIKGPNVMQGYWHMPQATDDTIKNGWLFTGDFATMDEDGYISIIDRKKDLIIVKGMNVYPREVEEVIYKYPGVDAVAVIGIPSIEQGEIIAAYIQAKENETIDEKDLRNYLAKHLANFKLPRIINVIENIPLTATGKVLKRELKELVKNGKI